MSDVRSIQDLIPYDIVMIHICIHIWVIFVDVGKYSLFPNQGSLGSGVDSRYHLHTRKPKCRTLKTNLAKLY